MYNQLSTQTSLIQPNQPYQAGRTHSHHNQSINHSLSSLASPDGSNSNQLSDCVADNLAQPFSNYISGINSNACRKDTTPPINATSSPSSSSSLVAIKREQAIMSPTGHLQEPYQDHSIITPQEQHQQQQQQQHHSYHQVQQQGGQIIQVANNTDNNNTTNYYQDTATAVVANQECHQDYYNMVQQHQHHHHHNPHHHHHHQQQQQHQQHHHHHQQQQQQQQHTRPLEPFTLPQQSHHQHQHHSQQASNTVVTPNAVASQCWPPTINQSTPPHVATSPAVINQFHLGNHPHQITPQTGPVLPAPVSPYPNHTNHTSSYTNGYQTQHQHQHYVSSNHHPHQHLHHHHQHHHQSNPQPNQHSQHNHHAIAMQSHATIAEDIYSPHQHPHHQTYNQFPRRSPSSSSSSSTIMTPAHSNINSLGIQQASSVSMNQASTIVHQAATIRHYSNTTSSHKIAPTSSESSSSLASRINSLTNNSASPKLNLLSSTTTTTTTSVNNSNQSISRRQSSSVISTSSAGSNPSDLHHSPTNSPSSIPPSGQVSMTPTTLDQIATRQGSLDERLSTNPTDAEHDSKESQLSQLHQQCAVLLDEQQQQQHPSHYVAINSPNSNNNNNGTNASNSTDSNNNNNNNGSSNTTTNGNNSGRSKRLRTSFKHNQLKEMKRSFSKNQNPDAKDLKTLAQITGLSKRVLQVWFQNARAKFRRNNAKAANQQLYDVSQHTSHMLQFQHQQHQQQQQNYHHHHHHTRPLPVDQSTISQQVAGQPHQHLPSQGSPTLTHTYVPLSGGHQVAPTLAVQGANNLIDQTTPAQPTSQPPQSTIHCNPKHDTCD